MLFLFFSTIISDLDDSFHQKPERPKDQNTVSQASQLLKGYACLFIAMAAYTVCLTSSQISGENASIFVANMFRFLFEIAFSVICILVTRSSLFVEKKNIYKFIIAATFNLIFVCLFYMSSSVLPLGNMDGIFAGFLIVISTLIDVVRGQISKWSCTAASLAAIGVLLLTQPWHTAINMEIPQQAPCQIIENNYYNISKPMDIYINESSCQIEDHHGFCVNPSILGYTYLFIASLACCLGDNMIKSLINTYSVYCYLFWGGITQAVFTGVTVIFTESIQSTNLRFPKEPVCLGFTFGFIIAMIISHTLQNVTFKYLPVSKVAMGSLVSIILLYIIQRTLLKDFQPGHRNLIEIGGILCIILAGIVSPIISIIYENDVSLNVAVIKNLKE